MAQATRSRERERPAKEDTRRGKPADEEETSDQDEDDDYDPDAEKDDNETDDNGAEAPAEDPRLAQMQKSFDALTKKFDALKKSIGTNEQFVEETYTTEELFKGIGNEFGLALAPLIARLEALEESNEAISKAMDEHGVVLEEVADKQEVIRKALGNVDEANALVKGLVDKQETEARETPSEGDTAPTGAVSKDDVLLKGIEDTGVESALTADDALEAGELLRKAQGILGTSYIAPDGYESAVDAMNEGRFTRATLETLRKGVDVAEKNAERLVKA